jgi:hypothetical protein
VLIKTRGWKQGNGIWKRKWTCKRVSQEIECRRIGEELSKQNSSLIPLEIDFGNYTKIFTQKKYFINQFLHKSIFVYC